MLAALLLPSPKDYQNDFPREKLIMELLRMSERITRFTEARGCPTPAPSASVIAALHQLSIHNLKKIETDFKLLMELINFGPNMVGEKEVSLFDSILKLTHLKIADEFRTRIEDDEVIELYRLDGVQFYRSLNIFKTTGYSLLDLNIHTWDELWERSSYSSLQINKVIADITSGKIAKYYFGEHEEVVRETLNSYLTEPFSPRTLRTNLGHLGACYDITSGEIRGFAVTTKCSVVSIGKDSEKIDFI